MEQTKLLREKAWFDCWIAVATSSTCYKHETATLWADECLKAFDSRFN